MVMDQMASMAGQITSAVNTAKSQAMTQINTFRATIKQQLDLHQHMGDAIKNLLHIALRLHCIRRPRLGD
jgi:hypothetical protein